MDKRLLVGGLLLLAFAIFCGVLANRGYHDSVGIFILIGFSVLAGLVIGSALPGKEETTEEDAKHPKH